MSFVTIVGAGLAGCEAAWQLAKCGIKVRLIEMRPGKRSPAHVTDNFGELVCSNSFRSDELSNAVGLLKAEMRRLDSIIIKCADENRVPAGGALAVDRSAFAASVTNTVRNHPLINIENRECAEIPEGKVIIATGPLTSDAFADAIMKKCGEPFLNFFDAAAPIISFDSIDMSCAWFASRYDKGTADYINCPMTEEEYSIFWNELINAQQAKVHGFDDSGVFEGCMPVEVMARRGFDTLRFGPLKPKGLSDPKTGREPFAVVQLRKDNAAGTMYNVVGFQTHLKFSEQKRVLGMIPALNSAEFLRYGVMHRNTYLDSPRLLDRYYRLRSEPRISFAGQITGVEGYVESAASGLLTGLETAREIQNKPPADFPSLTAIGALAAYVSNTSISDFQPMNINFGIIDSLDYKVKGKRNKNLEISTRSLKYIEEWLQ